MGDTGDPPAARAAPRGAAGDHAVRLGARCAHLRRGHRGEHLRPARHRAGARHRGQHPRRARRRRDRAGGRRGLRRREPARRPRLRRSSTRGCGRHERRDARLPRRQRTRHPARRTPGRRVVSAPVVALVLAGRRDRPRLLAERRPDRDRPRRTPCQPPSWSTRSAPTRPAATCSPGSSTGTRLVARHRARRDRARDRRWPIVLGFAAGARRRRASTRSITRVLEVALRVPGAAAGAAPDRDLRPVGDDPDRRGRASARRPATRGWCAARCST